MKKFLPFLSLIFITFNSFSQKVENVDFNFIDDKIVIYYDLLECDSRYRYDVSINFQDDRGNTIIPRHLSGDFENVTCGRNKIVEWNLFREVKQFEGNYRVIVTIANTYNSLGRSLNLNNTIAFSSAIPWAPFGLKYHFARSFGMYVSLNTDLFLIDEDLILSGGISKSIGNKANIYFGGAYNIAYEEFGMETGVLLKIKLLAVDIGVGYADVFYIRLGFGYNF